MNQPEFMVRVKLPESSGFHCSPSGDTEYEEAYQKALRKAVPVGFEISYPRLGHKWPTDSEGWTWVRLYCSDQKNALAYWMEECRLLKKKLEAFKKAAKNLE